MNIHEICTICPEVVCSGNKKGREITFKGKEPLPIKAKIKDCMRYSALAALGLVKWKFVGNDAIYEEIKK